MDAKIGATPGAIKRWFLTLLAAASCGGMLPPARNSGAAFSEEGVVLAVTGQNCRQERDPKRPGKTLLDATFAVEVGSSTPAPVAVHPGRFVLDVSDRSALPTPSREQAETTEVETGTTFRFLIHFVAAGLGCSQEMRLTPGSALEIRGQPVKIDSVRFVPSEGH